MEYRRIRKNILFGCLLIFVEVWNFIASVGISFTKYNYEYEFAGRRCVPNETAFIVDNVCDPMRCGRLCILDDICVSFSYEWGSSKCIGCRVNLYIWSSNTEASPDALYFHTKSTYRTDCKDILQHSRSPPNGLHEIRLWKSKTVIQVFCDMETDGGGWTVFQNRFDGSLDFHRNFSEYENGFGEMNGEFWLGLKYVQEMTSRGETEIRLDVATFDGTTFTETQPNFRLAKGPNYTLHIDVGSDVRKKDNLIYNNGWDFSTYDNDRDAEPTHHCASTVCGALWYRGCSFVYLNAKYRVCLRHRGFDLFNTLKTTKMMFR